MEHLPRRPFVRNSLPMDVKNVRWIESGLSGARQPATAARPAAPEREPGGQRGEQRNCSLHGLLARIGASPLFVLFVLFVGRSNPIDLIKPDQTDQTKNFWHWGR